MDFLIKRDVLISYSGPGGDVRVPEGVTKIARKAFFHRASPTSLTLPESLRLVEDRAFEDCAGLTAVSIHKKTRLEEGAFAGCTRLTSVQLHPENKNHVLRGNCLLDSGEKRVLGVFGAGGTVDIPEGVTRIGMYVFQGCTDLTGVTLPETVTGIGTGAFRDCTGLSGITLSEGVRGIGAETFRGCTGLSGIVLPEGLQEIRDGAFLFCTGLASVRVPGSVTVIPARAFLHCTSLTSVQIGEGVREIGGSAFRDCPNLTDVVIPRSVTKIDLWNFFCHALERRPPAAFVCGQLTIHAPAGSCGHQFARENDIPFQALEEPPGGGGDA